MMYVLVYNVQEHRLSYRNGDNKIAFAQLLITDGHAMGKIGDVMKVVSPTFSHSCNILRCV